LPQHEQRAPRDASVNLPGLPVIVPFARHPSPDERSKTTRQGVSAGSGSFDQLSSVPNRIEQQWSSPQRFRHLFFDSVARTTRDSTGRTALS